MILTGQYDSPFVRRVGIVLRLYGMDFRQEPLSVFGDKEKVALHNPLMRVPTPVLDDGESLIDSHAILDYLDSLVEPAKRLFPVREPARYAALQVAALATGLADKADYPALFKPCARLEATDVFDEISQAFAPSA